MKQREEMLEICNDDDKWQRFLLELGLKNIKFFRHGFISGVLIGGVFTTLFGCIVGMWLAK